MGLLDPPVEPMLARLARALPIGPDLVYEPKWDGFRCLAFRSGEVVDLRSRNQRPLARYFPEVADALLRLPARDVVLDGELLIAIDGRHDFAALMARLHPAASRVELLARTTPALLVAFDVLAARDRIVLDRPLRERRRLLEELVARPSPCLRLSPVTGDPAVARGWLARFCGAGIDGVVVKDAGAPYAPGRRAMTKVKLERTADCVVGGVRLAPGPLVSALLLGLYDGDGVLRHVGVASSFTEARRAELVRELGPLAGPLAGHPWEHGFALEGGPMGRLKGAAGRWAPELAQDWLPLAPERVCEVAFDQVDGRRLRHPARWRRWRPDRDPRSCLVDQLDQQVPDLAAVLGS